MISDRGQGLLRFNHFVDADIYNHMQINSNNACSQQLKPQQLKEPMYDCSHTYAIANYSYIAIHPIATVNWLDG